MEKKLRFAVVGTGMIAQSAHIPAILEAVREEAELAAVCDRDPERAAACARRFGVSAWFDDAEAMLSRIRPDVVCVCTPNNAHTGIVRLALESGAHVICEKPLALTWREGKELTDLAEAKGLLLVPCQTQRFRRGFMAAREYVEKGLVGTPYFGDIVRIRRRGIPSWGQFLDKAFNGGGALADIGVHAIDAMLWILGSPRVLGVTGFAARGIIARKEPVRSSSRECGMLGGAPLSVIPDTSGSDVEDFGSGVIRTEGPPVNFRVAWAAHEPNAFQLTVLGDKMGFVTPDMRVFGTLGQDQCDMTPRLFPLGPWEDKPFSGHYYLIANTVGALRGREPLIVRPEEALNTLAAIDLFYRSAALGREALRADLEKETVSGEVRA